MIGVAESGSGSKRRVSLGAWATKALNKARDRTCASSCLTTLTSAAAFRNNIAPPRHDRYDRYDRHPFLLAPFLDSYHQDESPPSSLGPPEGRRLWRIRRFTPPDGRWAESAHPAAHRHGNLSHSRQIQRRRCNCRRQFRYEHNTAVVSFR